MCNVLKTPFLKIIFLTAKITVIVYYLFGSNIKIGKWPDWAFLKYFPTQYKLKSIYKFNFFGHALIWVAYLGFHIIGICAIELCFDMFGIENEVCDIYNSFTETVRLGHIGKFFAVSFNDVILFETLKITYHWGAHNNMLILE